MFTYLSQTLLSQLSETEPPITWHISLLVGPVPINAFVGASTPHEFEYGAMETKPEFGKLQLHVQQQFSQWGINMYDCRSDVFAE